MRRYRAKVLIFGEGQPLPLNLRDLPPPSLSLGRNIRIPYQGRSQGGGGEPPPQTTRKLSQLAKSPGKKFKNIWKKIGNIL